MRVLTVILGCFLSGQISLGRPGEILPVDFPEFSKQGTVYAVAEASDGGVFVAGDFKEVDGVPRPGLAKLRPNGRLDESFTPTIAPTVWEKVNLLPPEPFSYYPTGFLPKHEKRLICLLGGGVIVMGEKGWELRDADGGLNTLLLSDIGRRGKAWNGPYWNRMAACSLRGGQRVELRFNLSRERI